VAPVAAGEIVISLTWVPKAVVTSIIDQRDAIAIVASQDGIVSFFAWDKEENRVTVIRHAEFVL